MCIIATFCTDAPSTVTVCEPSQSQPQSIQQQPAVVADVDTDMDRSANVCICDQLKPCTVDRTVAQAFGNF